MTNPDAGDVSKKYKLSLAYLGTNHDGWQSQVSGKGIQDLLTAALKTILRHDVQIVGAGRTDAGVHAEEQIAVFSTAVSFHAHRWVRGLNAMLPRDIRVSAVCEVNADFHPIRASRGKIYRYRIWDHEVLSPFVMGLVWHLPRATGAKLDADLIMREAQAFVGSHDFSSFCASDSGAKTRERTIHEIFVCRHGHRIDIWIHGGGFLKQMVRNMVGTLVEIAQKRRPEGDIMRIIGLRDRREAGRTAPAEGLTLVQVLFEQPLNQTQISPLQAAMSKAKIEN